MKKWLWLALIMILVMIALPAYALEAVGGTIGVDWTQVVVWIIGAVGTVLSTLLARVWMVYVKPWLEQKGLLDAAVIVVNAVEAIIGQYREGDKGLFSESKWLLALEKMQERGFDIDSDTVVDALKAAWQQLNLGQIAAGVKEPGHGEEIEAQPWMCGCGYEGDRNIDGGVCPKCSGEAICEWNG